MRLAVLITLVSFCGRKIPKIKLRKLLLGLLARVALLLLTSPNLLLKIYHKKITNRKAAPQYIIGSGL